MPAAVGDVLGIQCVWMPSGFSAGGASPPVPDVLTPIPEIRGIPAAIPKPRKRPDVAEISGFGYVSVLGSGTFTGEAALAGELLIAVDGTGNLTRETFRILIGSILTGAEAVICAESSLSSLLFQMHRGGAIVVADMHMSATGAVVSEGAGRMARDVRMVGIGRIRSGADGHLQAQENDEDWLLAAGALIARILTRRKR